MDITISEECFDRLVSFIKGNIEFISEVIAEYVPDDELAAAIEEKLNSILYFTSTVYNSGIIGLKQQAIGCCKKWLDFEYVDKDAANQAYMENINLKNRVETMEIPF